MSRYYNDAAKILEEAVTVAGGMPGNPAAASQSSAGPSLDAPSGPWSKDRLIAGAITLLAQRLAAVSRLRAAYAMRAAMKLASTQFAVQAAANPAAAVDTVKVRS